MSYKLRYDPKTNCVILRVEGRVTIDLICRMAPQVARICAERECRRFLNDMRKTEIDFSFVDLFESPKVMDESGVTRTVKRALVVPVAFEEAEFLETVTRNRGHNLMVFRDIKEAKRWLFSD